MKKEFTLLLVEIAFDLRLKFILQFKELNFLNKVLQKRISPVSQAVYFEKLLFILDLDISIGTDEIDKVSTVLYILDSK